jgi:hypothetical protein
MIGDGDMQREKFPNHDAPDDDARGSLKIDLSWTTEA